MNEKIDIAIIAGQLVVGGAERQLYLWLSNLDRKIFNPVILTLHPGHNDYWEIPIEELGIPLHRIPHRQSRLIRLVDIIRILQPYHPKLIHGWHLFASPYAGLAARLLGVRSLAGIRHTYQAFLQHPQEANLTLLTVDAILTNSYAAATGLQHERRKKNQKIYVVQNAVEEPRSNRTLIRAKLCQDLKIAEEKIWIGSLGRLDPLKRFDLTLKVISLLKHERDDFHFLLIGDGPERMKLETLARDLDITDVMTFTGEIPNAKELLTALDIFCFTSVDEGLPNVIMEAAMAELPIVAWKYPFIEELVENGTMALLVDPEALVTFKEKIQILIESSELRYQLGNDAKHQMLNRFSLNRYIQNMTQVYLSILGNPYIKQK